MQVYLLVDALIAMALAKWILFEAGIVALGFGVGWLIGAKVLRNRIK